MNKLYLESVVDIISEKDNQVYISKRIDFEIPFSKDINEIKTDTDIIKIIYEYLMSNQPVKKCF